jgi:hypothetical protein
MKSKHYLLLTLVPLSEAKALFYNSDIKVSWYLFSEHKRYLCNVVEDYSNIIILSLVFFYLTFVKIDRKVRQISLFLFILNTLDIIHLGLLDLQYFIALKLFISLIVVKLCTTYARF